MDEPITTAIERITRELEKDPYRPDLIVERLILQAQLGNLLGIQADLAIVKRLGIARTLLPMLARLEMGTSRVETDRGAYLVIDVCTETDVVRTLIRHLREIRQKADRFFGRMDDKLVVELAPGPTGLYHASREVAGIGYVRLSLRNVMQDGTSVLAHELAHLYLTSSNRFFDEGLALTFQAHCHDGQIYLGREVDLDPHPPRRLDQPFSLRALLAYDARNDVFFDRLAPDVHYKKAVYMSALTFARHVLEKLRMDGVKALCARLRAAPTTTVHPVLVAEALGERIEAIDDRLFQKPELTPVDFRICDHGGILPSTTIIWAELTPDDVNGLIDRLRRPMGDERLRIAAQACLARALVRRLMEDQSDAPLADVAELRTLVFEARESTYLLDREQILLQGWLAIAELRIAPTVPARLASWERALIAFDRALEKFPDDPEVLSATAALHLRGPEDYGANRALARQCLEKLSAIEGWLMVSKALARELREDAA